jgi:hypothetical protein
LDYTNPESVDAARAKYGPENVSLRVDTARTGRVRVRAYWHPEDGGSVGMRRIKVVDEYLPTRDSKPHSA